MASANHPDQDEEILVCSICLDILEDPKILPCLHRFCKKCLTKLINNNGGSSFSCPTCREETDIPKNGADGLKGDFLLNAIIEAKTIKRGLTGQQTQQTCSSCEQILKVVALCPDCGGLLCELCFSTHSTMKALKNHTHLVTLEDIQTGKVNFDATILSTLNAPKCTLHPDMTLHINCQTCDELICSVCAPIRHRDHDFEEVTSAAERMKAELNESLESAVEANKELDEALADNFPEFRRRFSDAFDKIAKRVTKYTKKKTTNTNTKMTVALERLKRKELKIKQKAETKIKNIKCGEEFLISEIEVRKLFYEHCAQEQENLVRSFKVKIKDAITTSRILNEEVDNWSIVQTVPCLQSSLSAIEDELENTPDDEPDLETPLEDIDFSEKLRFSPLCEEEWEAFLELDLLELDKPFEVTANLTDLKASLKAAQLMIASFQNEELVQVGIIDIKNSKLTNDFSYEIPDHTQSPQNVYVAGVMQGVVYSVANMDTVNLIHQDKYDNCLPKTLNLASSSVSCTAQCPGDDVFIVAILNSTTLYKFNFDAVKVSSIPVKVDDLKHPVSLAISEDGNILLCDGKSKAVAVNSEGELVYKYQSRHSTDKPMKISVDRRGVVYVLWEFSAVEVYSSDDESTCSSDRDTECNQPDTEEDGNEKHEDSTDADNTSDEYSSDEEEENTSEESENDSSCNENELEVIKLVMQYCPSGTFISEFKVSNDATMMTTVMYDDDIDVVAVAEPGGDTRFYQMTDFGRKLSEFVLAKDGMKGCSKDK